MAYTPPAGNAVNFNFTGAYTPPAGNAVDFSFVDSAAFELAISPTLSVLSAAIEAEHAQPIDLQIALQLQPLQPSIELILDNVRDLTIAATLPQIQSDLHLARGAALTLTTELPGMICGVDLQWGESIPVVTLTGGSSNDNSGYRWGVAAIADIESDLPHNDSPNKQSSSAGRWQNGTGRNTEPEMPHSMLPQFDTERSSGWDSFISLLNSSTDLPSNYPLPTDLIKYQLWADFVLVLDKDHLDPWNWPPPVDVDSLYQFQRVDDFGDRLIWDTRDYTPPWRYEVNFSFTEAYTPPAADVVSFSWGAASPYENQPIRPIDPGKVIAHNTPPSVDESREAVWGDGSWTRPTPDYAYSPGWTAEPEEEAARPPQPDIRGVYIFMPVLTLYRTPDGAEIAATNVNWSTDADSWGWRFSATIKHESDIALLKPDSNGPREIACEINGHLFTAIVESYGRTRQFGQTGLTIKGKSRSGILSDPYAPKRSKAISAPYTAQQLAEQELANTGWTLDWQATDWLIPGGAFSYHELDPIAVIKRLANTAGAIVQSHAADKQLIVKPRYPVSPHKWNDPGTALDAILPASLIHQAGSQFKTLPTYNRAIVAGGKTGGVIVTLTRDGTAGDELAPLVTDDLVTHQSAGYERARIEIAKGGTWEEMSFTTWLTDYGLAPGLLLPGHLVEIQDLNETYPVQISGTTINAQSNDQGLTVRQQLSADRRINA
ncbi:hypothetical protein SAMN03080615_00891 [Amphritea atlantica]|uniref:Phage tail protein n=1 Tax=Amphritea atlantica TaxID=355243 RepID=A0A1H9EH55_9GAMM|nr:hypothetical protein [Amphritea atlantica]SEQ24867.1 hypothetical protein SAMN03080615_00891 [Amphritea atlantica]